MCVRQKKGYFWLVLGVNKRKVLIIWIFKDKVKLYKDFREKIFFHLSSPLNTKYTKNIFQTYPGIGLTIHNRPFQEKMCACAMDRTPNQDLRVL